MSISSTYTIGADNCPNNAWRVIEALECKGFEAWIVGGWVRDMLRGAQPHDVDIATNALWQESKMALEAASITVHETGTAHGTITAVIDSEPIEVTTYRIDGSYSDARHPDNVIFVTNIAQDLARRDFTVNAMAWHPKRGLIDPYRGQNDIKHACIRAVGDPRLRFSEDALRILRAVRFACRLGYQIEPNTQQALEEASCNLKQVASERIGIELRGIVDSGRLAWALRNQSSAMLTAIPSLEPLVGFEQHSPYHCYDVYEHTLRVVEAIEFYSGGLATEHLRWAAMLHDIGKPDTFFVDEHGQGHFYGHPKSGAQITSGYLRKLAIPSNKANYIVALVRLHDRPMDATITSELKLLRDLDAMISGKSRLESLSLMHEMLDLRRADALAKSPEYRSYATELEEHERLLRTIEKTNLCWRLDDLALRGSDLIAAGIKPGPQIGKLLQTALDGVIEEKVANATDSLKTYLNL